MLTRILLRLFLVAGLAAPLSAFALGVGPLEVRSSLNQAFEAEIPLIISNPVELIGLAVRIPRQQDFDHVGVERLSFFSKLRFSVKTAPSGSSVIQVTSLEPIREPNFNLLLELAWPRGRLLREFPVQLDPELYAHRRLPPPLPLPIAAEPPVAAPPPPVKASPAVPVLPPAPSVSFEGASFYGPVKPGETLTAVARQVRPSPTIAVPQMMSILIAGNPEAFVGGNPNTLRAGATLKVPSSQALGVPSAPTPLETPEPAPAPPIALPSPPSPLPTIAAPLPAPEPAQPSIVTEPVAPPPPSPVTPSPSVVTAAPPIPSSSETSPTPPVLSPTERPQEIIPQASIPQPVAAPPTTVEPAPPPIATPQPVSPPVTAPQPTPPVVKLPPASPVIDSEASWTDNPVVWVAIALIVLAVGAVVLLPLLRRPARPKAVTESAAPAIVPDDSTEETPAITTQTHIREPRSMRSQPVSAVPATPSGRLFLDKKEGEASSVPVSKPVVVSTPKPIDEMLKDMDRNLSTDQTVIASSKGAARDAKAPLFDAEPPTASVTRRPMNPFAVAAPPTEPGVRPTPAPQSQPQPQDSQIEELPSELRLDGLDFDFGDFGLEHTARPKPSELPPLEMSPNVSSQRPTELPPLEFDEPKTLVSPPAKSVPTKPALEDLKFEFTDVRLEKNPSSSDEPLRLDAELQNFGGDDTLALGKMTADPDSRSASSSTDYVETKLDLATAYLDMGDQVGARNLLDEVLKEGDAAQKQRAGELRKKLG